MAYRAFARIGTDFHDEPSIRDLTTDQQWAYDVVLKRPDLSRCGVVSYTPRRWAKFANGMTEPKLRRLITHLVNTRHLVLDDDTEELLARTYVRHDGLLTQPNVVAAMVSDYRLIQSDTIRTAFLTEMRRIWDLDIEHNARGGWLLAMGHYPPASDDGKVRFPDGMRDSALTALRRNIGSGLSADLTQAIQQGSVEPFHEGSEKGSPEPFREGSSRARGRVAVPVAAAVPDSVSDSVAAATPASAGEGAPRRSSGHEHHLLDIHQADLGPLPAITATALGRHLATAVAQGSATDDQLLAALAEWRRRPDAKPGLLPHLIGDATRETPDPDALTPDELAFIQTETARRTAAAAGGHR